jgi:catechol 2,3-dioxygenase-like lactoylglutathione lyase family enzyme
VTTTRVQLALNVADIATATDFYSKLFGVAPHKQRPGYANFVVEDPPLKLVLFENPDAPERLNHLGIETTRPDDVPAAEARFRSVGLQTRLATSDRCCHAVQDKIFVAAPDVPNGWWEYYAITDDEPKEGGASSTEGTVCCTNQQATGTNCCQ